MLNGARMKKNAAGITVVIPNYNYADFIVQTLDSIAGQHYNGEVRMIVADDGSTDDSVRTVDAWLRTQPARVAINTQLVARRQNSGKNATLNAVLPLVGTELVMILDSDDMLLPGALGSMHDALQSARQRDDRVAFAYSDCLLVDSSGAYLNRGRSRSFDPLLVDTKSYIPECALTNTAALLQALPLDPTVRRGTKHDKYRRLVYAGWAGTHLAQPLFAYRMHQENISGIGRRVMRDLQAGTQDELILSGYWPTTDFERLQIEASAPVAE